MAHVSLILGGARSGKSAYALQLAAQPPHTFIATAEVLDDEMAERVALHKRERGPDWGLVEAPLELAAAVTGHARTDQVLLVDCLTLWLSNIMHHDRQIETETVGLIKALRAAPGRIVAVSNEVGLGLVPETPLGRRFRDEQGRLNRRVAEMADSVEFIAAGLPLRLK